MHSHPRTLAPQLPKLSNAVFRDKYKYREIPPVERLCGEENGRGVMGRDEQS